MKNDYYSTLYCILSMTQREGQFFILHLSYELEHALNFFLFLFFACLLFALYHYNKYTIACFLYGIQTGWKYDVWCSKVWKIHVHLKWRHTEKQKANSQCEGTIYMHKKQNKTWNSCNYYTKLKFFFLIFSLYILYFMFLSHAAASMHLFKMRKECKKTRCYRILSYLLLKK